MSKTADPRTFGIDDKVVMRGDTQWTGVVTGVGYGEVQIRWDHQTDTRTWTPTSELENITRPGYGSPANTTPVCVVCQALGRLL